MITYEMSFILVPLHPTFSNRFVQQLECTSFDLFPWTLSSRVSLNHIFEHIFGTMGKKRVLVSYGVDIDAVAGWLGSVRSLWIILADTDLH